MYVLRSIRLPGQDWAHEGERCEQIRIARDQAEPFLIGAITIPAPATKIIAPMIGEIGDGFLGFRNRFDRSDI